MRQLAVRNPLKRLPDSFLAWAAFTCATLAADSAAAQFVDPLANVTISVATDQTSYLVGEPIEIRITAHNAGTSPVTLSFPSSLQAFYEMDDVYTPPLLGLAILTDAVVPAMGSHDWSYWHRWDDYDLSIGQHSVTGSIVNYFESAPQNFSIVASPAVENDVFIDFESYPSGDAMIGVWQKAYEPWGVAFSSDGPGVALKIDSAGNNLLHTSSGGHPFNVVADFAMPVYGVSAEVGTAADCSVQLLAFDANDNLIGSIESSPAAAYPDMIGRLSFVSDVPIASVKWLSSNPLAVVMIDNLRLEVDGVVPEPSSFLLGGISVIGLLRSLRCRDRRSRLY